MKVHTVNVIEMRNDTIDSIQSFNDDKIENEGNGNHILLHCANGSNRSVTIAIALLMVLNGRHPFPSCFIPFLLMILMIRMESFSILESYLFLKTTSCPATR